ncbi:MAG TPA: hypothetical protein VF865_22015 [Acidobacteriaceae bacterium]
MMILKAIKAVVALAVTAVLANAPSASAPAESFDKPVRKTVVNLGRSRTIMPNYPARIQLSCFYYPGFMVKELYDQGVKGSQWVAIAPVINGDAPACRLAHASTEQFMTQDGWFFEGVKGSLLFLEASEGDENFGMPFRILDMRTGKKVFEDSARGGRHLEFAHASDGNISLRYLRRVGGDCSIPKDGMSCWRKFRKHYGLAFATVPRCVGYRHQGDKEWTVDDPGVPPEEINVPSALDYPVVVELFPQPSIRAAPGPVNCFAE